MAVTVVVELSAKPDCAEALKSLWREIMADTRAYDGCIDIYVYENQDEPDNFVLIENWDSRAHYDRYLAWRAETGLVEQVTSMCSGDLRFGFYDRSDI